MAFRVYRALVRGSVWILLATPYAISSGQDRDTRSACVDDPADPTNWVAAKQEMWECVEKRTLTKHFAARMLAMEGQESRCYAGVAGASAIFATHSESVSDYINPFQLGIPLADLVDAGFPTFGALEWLSAEQAGKASQAELCTDQASREFKAVLIHHVRESSPVPALPSLEYIGQAASSRTCKVGQAAGLLGVALSIATQANSTDPRSEILYLMDRADKLLVDAESASDLGTLLRLGQEWPVWTLLHRLVLLLSPPLHRLQSTQEEKQKHSGGCIVMVYAFPTDEIRNDTEKALKDLETHYFQHFDVRYPIIVFTDEATAPKLSAELGVFTSAPIVPAVMPKEEMMRPMSSYSCVGGVDCVAGATPLTSAHRGNVNATQFWSADYLRISRYTAGPLFMHPALDDCGAFVKVDTDFFLTGPMRQDPIAEIRREGTQLAYWQIHVQGQRQAGYTEASLEFLGKRGLRIRNGAFYARGRFEERAKKLGIDVSAVPEALEAATVVYGCLFGGDVRFFREPLYRDFFDHMDAKSGFETNGWSNQFFLGTAAAAFVWPSQVRRLYISARHQESKIDIAHGNVTEFLLGSLKSVLR